MQFFGKILSLAILALVSHTWAAPEESPNQMTIQPQTQVDSAPLTRLTNQSLIPASATGVTVSLAGNALWAHMNDVAVDGNYAYCVMNEGLMILDVTTLSAPAVVKYVLLPGRGDAVNSGYTYDGGIALSGSYAYVSGGNAGLYVVDISVPSAASVVGHCSTRQVSRDLAITGNYVCVADADSGLQIIDVTTPAAPSIIGTYRGGYAYSVAAAGNYVYLGQYGFGTKIIDISNPSSPSLVSSYAGMASGLAVDGNYLYVAGAFSGLDILDISNPAAPSLASHVGYPAWDVTVTGNLACLVDGTNAPSIVIVDVTDPLAPVTKATWGAYGSGGGFYHAATSGNVLFAPDLRYGLKIINVANPISPSLVGECSTASILLRATVAGSMAYVCTDYTGLWAVDVTTVAAPIVVSNFSNAAYDAVVSGDYLYANTYFGLETWWVSNPAFPVRMSTYNSGTGGGLAVFGTRVYFRNQILNLSNPSAPTLLGSHAFGSVFAVSGNYAYACAGSAGLNVIDISNPASPTLAGNYNTPGRASYVVLSGSYAYVADSNSLQIINVSNPSSPVFAGSFATAATAYHVSVANNYANLAETGKGSGLEIVDVTNPTAPSLAGAYDSPGLPQATAASGNHVFLVDYDGLLILNLVQTSCCTGTTGNVNMAGIVDVSDLSLLVSYLTSSPPPSLPCLGEANVNATGIVDVSDLSLLVAYLTSSPAPALPNCP